MHGETTTVLDVVFVDTG